MSIVVAETEGTREPYVGAGMVVVGPSCCPWYGGGVGIIIINSSESFPLLRIGTTIGGFDPHPDGVCGLAVGPDEYICTLTDL